MKTSKNTTTKIMIGIALLSIFILYYSGIKAEKDCLALGHSVSQCANLSDGPHKLKHSNKQPS